MIALLPEWRNADIEQSVSCTIITDSLSPEEEKPIAWFKFYLLRDDHGQCFLFFGMGASMTALPAYFLCLHWWKQAHTCWRSECNRLLPLSLPDKLTWLYCLAEFLLCTFAPQTLTYCLWRLCVTLWKTRIRTESNPVITTTVLTLISAGLYFVETGG